MDRSEYLRTQWTPYPTLPAQTVAAGRVWHIENGSSPPRLILIRDQKKIEIQFAATPPEFLFLQEGDLVAITSSKQVVLLAPQQRPLPPRNFDKDLLLQWQKYLQTLRRFFYGQDFLEVQTPSLVACPGTEPSLDVFSTELVVGSRREKLYLPTSPEIHLKKALALGAEKIFEMAPCFRNGEITERHQPQFLMLEWYRAYCSLEEIKRDVQELISNLAQALGVEEPASVQTYSVAELFKIHCDFELKTTTTAPELKALAENLGVDVRSAQTIDDYFFLIFMEKIETQFSDQGLVFVEKYPPYQAALARLTADGWGDRFEVYWRGLELANAFHELNDPELQRSRAQEDLDKKRHAGKEVVPLDEEFFHCLEAGLPPSAGIALGVERLFMALTSTGRIKDLHLFSY